ncbi:MULTISPECIES: hypothetical protein [Bradyrhizobium]|uniref:hypothetical protein n=1 Tax=Bradyrhizobium TaxID=374 RepID=UPI00116000FE|nr:MULTISPECIES: hypothetical protein [Bradyrhizobium]
MFSITSQRDTDQAKSKAPPALTLVKPESNKETVLFPKANFKAGWRCGAYGQFAGDCSDHSDGVLFGRCSNGENQGRREP